jgi:hypothetical protein
LTPHPLPARECVHPAFGAWGGHTRQVERGWGVNSSEDARHCSVFYICKWVHSTQGSHAPNSSFFFFNFRKKQYSIPNQDLLLFLLWNVPLINGHTQLQIFFLYATSVSPIEKRSTFVVTDQFITIHSKKDGQRLPLPPIKRRKKNEHASFLSVCSSTRRFVFIC